MIRLNKILNHIDITNTREVSGNRVLVCNRGEIAVRILQTLEKLSIDNATIYAPDDQASKHVQISKQAYPLALHSSIAIPYLDMEQIIDIAKKHNCNCIHPGIGFLSENPIFRKLCDENGIIFVGPSQACLEVFSDKDQSRKLAQDVGIPVVKGQRVNNADEAKRFLGDIKKLSKNASIILKAVAGGGGVGMRVVSSLDDVETSFKRCQSEAIAAFGLGDILAEQYVPNARHVEVQIVGDGNNVITLGERECSIQRKHQKVIEVCPCPNITIELRKKLFDAAMAIGKKVKYVGVGTVEFLVSGDFSDFYFMEVNPRLQVEHTVTEGVIPGLDLVSVQLHLVLNVDKNVGKKITDLIQSGIIPSQGTSIHFSSGYAIQCRVNMEQMQPDGAVIPSSFHKGARITRFDIPHGLNTRIETHAYPNYLLPSSGSYDSLLAKVIVFLNNPKAEFKQVAKMAARAIHDFKIEGAETNLAFLLNILNHPAFYQGEATLNFIQDNIQALVPPLSKSQQGSDSVSADSIVSPLQGQVISIELDMNGNSDGLKVPRGKLLAVISAMKMEHEIRAQQDVIIKGILVQKNDMVMRNQPLFSLFPTNNDGSYQKVISPLEEAESLVNQGVKSESLLELEKFIEYTKDISRPIAMKKRHTPKGRDTGFLSAVESVTLLCDENSSFLEYGRLVTRMLGAIKSSSEHGDKTSEELVEELRKTTPRDGVITGIGQICSKRVAVIAYDYTVLAGTQGAMGHMKQDRLLKVALAQKMPVVIFAEGGGGRPGDFGMGFSGLDSPTFRMMAEVSGKVPTVSIVTNLCFAGNAVLAGVCDCIIATKDSSLGMAGPAMIYGGGLGDPKASEVGPADMHYRTGVVDILVDNDIEAIACARKYLSFLETPQHLERNVDKYDQKLLRHLVPENRRRSYNVREIIKVLCDKESVLELRGGYGIGIISCLAKIQGVSVGVVANNIEHLSGALDGDGSDKMARFLELCNRYKFPVVTLSDTPGFMVGVDAETTGLVRRTSRLFAVSTSLTVPVLAVILRKSYGLGAMAMTGGGHKDSAFTISWPNGEVGPMGLEGAIRLGFRKQLESIKDDTQREEVFQELVKHAYARAKVSNVSTHFDVDDVVDPALTRDWIIGLLESMFTYKAL